MPSSTKDRIVDASAELFRRNGYTGTGVKQIVAAAGAPFGSLYHFFPGGKEELGAAAVRTSGALYGQLVPAVFDPAPDILTGVRTFFNAAAASLTQRGSVAGLSMTASHSLPFSASRAPVLRSPCNFSTFGNNPGFVLPRLKSVTLWPRSRA